jgi:colanic acid biosynthesis glycosyl transferase WcaI
MEAFDPAPDRSSAGSPNERILVHTFHHAPELIGVGRFSGDIVRHLAQQGHEVTVVAATPFYPQWRVHDRFSRWYSVQREERILTVRCPLLMIGSMRSVGRMIAPISFALSAFPVMFVMAWRQRPTVIMAVEPTLFTALATTTMARFTRARTVLHVQDLELDAAFDLGFLRSPWMRRAGQGFERWLRRRFDSIITISGRMAARLVENGVDPARISVVRNWVDLNQIRPLGRPSRFRALMGLRNDVFVVLYAGSITRKTAIHLVMDAAASLVGRTDIRFVIVGDGLYRDTARSRKLPNVDFLPLQPPEEMCELLNLADMHVLPQDPAAADLMLPSKLAGMLASGKRLAVMADPGTELHGLLNGIAALVPAGSAACLADAIVAAADSGQPHDPSASLELATLFSKSRNLTAFEDILLGKRLQPDQTFSATSSTVHGNEKNCGDRKFRTDRRGSG